jgi:hypothetical protein
MNMTIQRVTLEIDNIPDIQSLTGTTSQPQVVNKAFISNQTSSLESYKNSESVKDDDLSSAKPTTGRTLGDLVVEFKDDPRVMTIVLTIISFTIFVTKLDSLDKFTQPLVLTLILNLTWHLFPGIIKLFTKGSTA